jgi:spermidine/putrescine-binding protein
MSRSELSRGAFLKRCAALGVAIPMGLDLAGCGSSSSGGSPSGSGGASTGTVSFLNIPGYIGPNTVAAFEKENPGITVKQVAPPGDSDGSGIVPFIALNPGTIDVTYADGTAAPLLAQAHEVVPPTVASIPNLAYQNPVFTKDFPWGVPTDFGKEGIGYRADLVSPAPASWKDFWRMAALPKYSGKVIMTSTARDAMQAAFEYLGLNPNSSSDSAIQKAGDALSALKPHLLAFKNVNQYQDLLNGTAVMVFDYDFEVALANQQNPHVKFVKPSDGVVQYVEGWVQLKTSREDITRKFINYISSPAALAAKSSTDGTTPTMKSSAILPHLAASKKYLVSNPILAPDPQATPLGPISAATNAKYLKAMEQVMA